MPNKAIVVLVGYGKGFSESFDGKQNSDSFANFPKTNPKYPVCDICIEAI